MAKPTPGLRKRGLYWHIDKTIHGVKIRESTHTGDLTEAERILADRLRTARQQISQGDRPVIRFEEAAVRYLSEHRHKRSISRDIGILEKWMPVLGATPLQLIHDGIIAPRLELMQRQGLAAATANRELAVIRRILTLAARLWRDDAGRPWIDTAPLLRPVYGEARQPRPLTWDEQTRLFRELPLQLAEMALFAVNTGLRDQELCGLRWDWECQLTGTTHTVFILPGQITKNSRERIIPLNAIARSIIEARRSCPGEYVFSHDGLRRSRMISSAWVKARRRAELQDVRVHDLRHTFGMRLRAAGVGLEDRQDLLGHHAGRITTHYSRVGVEHLIACVERLCDAKTAELSLIKIVA